MGRFLTALEVRHDPDPEGRGADWVLTAPLVFGSNVIPGRVEIPAGFRTDYASVPRLPLVFWLTGDVSHASAVVHDYLYSTGAYSRKKADAVFEEAMQAEGVGWLRRKAMWAAVRVFGGGRFRRMEDDNQKSFQ